MSAAPLSHSTTPTTPPISTVSVGRFSVDFGTLYKLVTIVSGVAIAVFAILEVQYLVAACALTLSAFAIYSCFNREPVPQTLSQLPAVTSTQQPPRLGNPLNPSASTTVASSENNDSQYNSADEEVEGGPPLPQRVQQAATAVIGTHRTDQNASDLPLVRQATYTNSPYQPPRTQSLSQPSLDDESRSGEGEGPSGSENDQVEIFPLNFDSFSVSDDDQNPPDIARLESLRERIAPLLDGDD